MDQVFLAHMAVGSTADIAVDATAYVAVGSIADIEVASTLLL